jgi:galactokinase
VRITGDDVDGCVVALLPDNLIAQVKTAILYQYSAITSLKESIYVCLAEDGAKHIITIRN